jgi:predicted acylesterase/phospholipase RssA
MAPRHHHRHDGSLSLAVRASISIPGLLPPVQHGERLLIDGGLLNNLPADVMCADQDGEVICVDLRRKFLPSKGFGLLPAIVQPPGFVRRLLTGTDVVLPPLQRRCFALSISRPPTPTCSTFRESPPSSSPTSHRSVRWTSKSSKRPLRQGAKRRERFWKPSRTLLPEPGRSAGEHDLTQALATLCKGRNAFGCVQLSSLVSQVGSW